ncbi:MAG TPA: non-canonical purine NTP pyrophosphatase, RdgB/HAM1 family [Ruminococcaceae bacterium]|nr:non-canonical purine NTP pyrophosphatase, RdgB/HAM1 family [Oscillospiraceae bacterium]
MQLVAATNNQGKLKEMQRILKPLNITVLSLKDVNIDIDIDENGKNFAENARIKAEAIFRLTGKPTIADDSGLCVDALGGEPGVYTARYSGENATDDSNISKLLNKLEGVPKGKRTARFVCALCFIIDESTILECEGVCDGEIGWQKLGENGFGYDPVFMMGNKSFSQLSADEKDAVSHRGKALKEMFGLICKYKMKF